MTIHQLGTVATILVFVGIIVIFSMEIGNFITSNVDTATQALRSRP